MKNRLLSLAAALLAATTCLTHADTSTPQDAASQANNPLANSTAFNIQNYYIGELTGIDEDANQFLLRYAQPVHFLGGNWLIRATLPVNTLPTGTQFSHDTGLGDFNIFAAYLFNTGTPGLSIGLGPQLTAPTATDAALGSEQWSAGFAHVLFNGTSKKIQYGYLLTWQSSFAGQDDRRDVNTGAFQPFVFLQLGQGWYLRSSAVSVFDFDNNDYTIPIGLGIGRVIPTPNVVYNLFVEPQYSIADRGNGFAQWQVFCGFNMQF